MRIKDLEKLKKEKTPKQIIYAHIHNKIFLTDYQVEQLIKEKNKKWTR